MVKLAKIKFATYYNKDSWHVDNGTEFKMESLTDQSFRDMADVNSLILSMGGTPRTPVGNPVYNLENYATSSWTFEDWQNQKALLERRFMHLTPEAKQFFGSPQEFLKYCSNPNNYTLENGVMEIKDKKPEVTIQSSTPVGDNQGVTQPVFNTQ